MNNTFIKADENKLINEKCIKWVKKIDECLEVCTKADGCYVESYKKNTHRICKLHNPESYNKLNKYFDS